MAKEEWQDPDSGYLNCIGVGDTYVKKQIERILSQNKLTADRISLITLNLRKRKIENLESKLKNV